MHGMVDHLENGGHHVVERPFARVDGGSSHLAIRLVAIGGQQAQSFDWIAVDQRAMIASGAHTSSEDRGIGPEPHHLIGAFQQPTVGGAHDDATTGGDQHWLGITQDLTESLFLQIPEFLLTVGLEDLADGAPTRPFDPTVEIHEGQTEPLGQPATRRTLADAHHADEHDLATWFVPLRRHELVRLVHRCDVLRVALRVNSSTESPPNLR